MLKGVERSQAGREGYEEVRLDTERGAVACRHYAAPGARTGAVFVGGVGGGWDTPAQGLYPRLCAELPAEGVACLRVRFRNPRELIEAVPDVLDGIEFLAREGIERIALVGHSFGGAVVIRAAAQDARVRAVVTLATQGYGAGDAARLGPRCALLLLHGMEDRILPPSSSEYVFGIAQEPKDIHLFARTDHVMDEAAESVHAMTRDWILRWLREDGRPSRPDDHPDTVSAPSFPPAGG